MNHSRPVGTPLDEAPRMSGDPSDATVGRTAGRGPASSAAAGRAEIEGVPTMSNRNRPADGWTLVWVDERRACILQWIESDAAIQRFTSTVPPRRRSTGHVRHDPATRHGGSGGDEAGEPRRMEHLAAFIRELVAEMPASGNIVVAGPGETRDHLAAAVREADAGRHLARIVEAEPADRLTERQLVARLRELNGAAALRRTGGSWRWTGAQPANPSGAVRPPQRISAKRSVRPGEVAAADEMTAELDELATVPRTHGARAGS